MVAWLWPLLRCPYCMSEISEMSEMSDVAFDGAALGDMLHCPSCLRSYPVRRLGIAGMGAGVPVPRLRRDDGLATLAQDIVAERDNRDVTRPHHVSFVERREQFVAWLLRRVSEPYAILAGAPARPDTPLPGELASLDRFVELLPSGGLVLDLACGSGRWTLRLLRRGLRVAGADDSLPSLTRAVEATAPHPPAPSPSRGEGEHSAPHPLPAHVEGEGEHGATHLLPASENPAPLSHGQKGENNNNASGDGVPQRGTPSPLATTTSPLPAEGEGASFVEADMMAMPFATASLDGVWCSEAFAYVRPDRRTIFFRQAHRVLRPGGLLYISARTRPLHEVVRWYLLWRVVMRRPVVFGEYIYRLPRSRGGSWHYHAMTSARVLNALCRAHGFEVLSLRRERMLWLLLARKRA